jgi:hypothetical protein
MAPTGHDAWRISCAALLFDIVDWSRKRANATRRRAAGAARRGHAAKPAFLIIEPSSLIIHLSFLIIPAPKKTRNDRK